ncbi:MAG: phosphoenolpyruvate--protein phosphotransferase [Candidatus Heimdallarchaeota archaeon]
MKKIIGIPGSPGIAIGKARVFKAPDIQMIIGGEFQDLNPNEAIILFKNATNKALERLSRIVSKVEEEIGSDEAGVFDAQMLMIEDEDFQSEIIEKIKNNIQLVDSIKSVSEKWQRKFEAMEDDYFKERGQDIKDAGNQILQALLDQYTSELSDLDEAVIIVADELTPSDTAEMNKSMVLAIATETGGPTSHAVILSRSLNIPAVVGTGTSTLLETISNSDTLVVDGSNGEVIIDPDLDTIQSYESKKVQYAEEEKLLQRYKEVRAITKDNHEIQLNVNLGSIDDLGSAMKVGAEGVGLLRTEFMYLNRINLPTEEELFSIFRKFLEGMEKYPVIIRTLDIGGDKELAYINLPKEVNPFLGLRGTRLASQSEFKQILTTQIRAALRASVHGNLKIMFPMITTAKEVSSLMRLMGTTKQNLQNEGYEINRAVEVGIMVEVPSVAICADIIAPFVDFFSIGTNDLTQYTLATDRTNESVAYLYDHYHPSVIRLIQGVIEGAHSHGKWVGVCGELASEPLAIPLLIGLGIDELSMQPHSLLRAKKIITEITYLECKILGEKVLRSNDPEDIYQLLKDFQN